MPVLYLTRMEMPLSIQRQAMCCAQTTLFKKIAGYKQHIINILDSIVIDIILGTTSSDLHWGLLH